MDQQHLTGFGVQVSFCFVLGPCWLLFGRRRTFIITEFQMLWWFFCLVLSPPSYLCPLNHVVFYEGQYFRTGVSLPSCFLSSQAVRGIPHLLSSDYCYPACCCFVFLVNCYFLTFKFLFYLCLLVKVEQLKLRRAVTHFGVSAPQTLKPRRTELWCFFI